MAGHDNTVKPTPTTPMIFRAESSTANTKQKSTTAMTYVHWRPCPPGAIEFKVAAVLPNIAIANRRR